MIGILIILVAFAAGGYIFMQQPIFGKEPSGKRLERIKKSPNYKNDVFENLSATEVMRKGASTWGMLKDYFNKPKDNTPLSPIPTKKSSLLHLSDSTEAPIIVWFGHSSYLLSYKGKNILVDPVFSGSASPISFFGKSYEGTEVFSVSDFPDIDLLLITHDHYDHLDYNTMLEFKPKVKQVVTGLGVGEHLEYWGYDADKITELDWWDSTVVKDFVKLTSTPARHFSGRGFKRAKSLWSSFVIELDTFKIFAGGDSGYDTLFKKIGEQHGPFDLALLECGQYGKDWPSIHMTPEETALAATELKANIILPVHWGKFSLALHSWTEPIERLQRASAEKGVPLCTPMIGEPWQLSDKIYDEAWWRANGK